MSGGSARSDATCISHVVVPETWLDRNWQFLLIAILAFHVSLVTYSCAIHSPAWDEVGYLVAGIDHWERTQFDFYRVNPPLPRMLATIPAVVIGHKPLVRSTSRQFAGRPEWPTGMQFLRDHGRESFQYFVLGRCMLIPISIIGALVLFNWAREIYGLPAGLTAALLWCTEPNLLASAALMTPDLAATTSGVCASYTFRRWLNQPNWHTAVYAGLGLASAEMTKMTWVILFGLWPLVWLLNRFWLQPDRNTRWRRDFCQGLLIMAIPIYALNLEYGFEGTGQRLGDFVFVSESLRGAGQQDVEGMAAGNRFKDSWLQNLPVPLPADYVSGIDLQKRDFEIGYWSYLMGEMRQQGWWYYYLCALAWKVPLGIWALVILGTYSAWKLRGNPAPSEQFLVAVIPVFLIAFVSSQTGFNHHLRYVLPSIPFVLLWSSQATRLVGPRFIIAPRVAAVSLLWAVSSSLSCYPHSLSYFNEIVGGPTRAAWYLGSSPMDSNLEWGQDVLLLRDWLDQHPQIRLDGLACGGMGEFRSAFDLPTNTPPRWLESTRPGQNVQHDGPQAGWYAVSVKDLYTPNSGFNYFREFQPYARIGFSLLIFGISSEEAAAYHQKHETTVQLP